MAAIVKVSSRSSPNAVAGALAGVVRSEGEVEIQVVGAGALNQAVKAIAIARSFFDAGLDLACRPTFTTIDIDGQPRTAIRLFVKRVAADGTARTGDPDPEPELNLEEWARLDAAAAARRGETKPSS